MTEPIDPPIRAPVGGWPKLMMRLEPVPYSSREEVYYTLACLARRWRVGVIALLDGIEVVGFPHQTTDEIARGHIRELRLARAAAAPDRRAEVTA